MFGLDHPSVALGYLFTLLSVLFCIGYGIANWNKGDESVQPEDEQWVKNEKEVQESL